MLARHCRCVFTTNRSVYAPQMRFLLECSTHNTRAETQFAALALLIRRLVMRGLIPCKTRTERSHGSKLELDLSSCKLAFLRPYSCKDDAVASHGCRAQGADAAALCELGQFAQDDALRTLTSVRQRIHTRSGRRRDPATSSHDAQTHRGRCAHRCVLYLHATRKT